MNLAFTEISIIPLATAGLAMMIAIIAWRRRAMPGCLALSLLMLAIVEWTVARAFEAAVVGMSSKILWGKIEYPGIVSVPVIWLVFVLKYIRQDDWMSVRNVALLCIMPAITLGMVWTNDLHGWIWTNITPSPGRESEVLVYEHGWWFWLNTCYSYIVVLVGTLRLIRVAFIHQRLFRRQSMGIIIAAGFPWLGNAIYLSGRSPIPGLDLTPLAFTLSALVIGWSIIRYRLFEVVPIARDTLIENMDDAVLVLDLQDRIVDVNPAARRLLGASGNLLIGEKAAASLVRWSSIAPVDWNGAASQVEIVLNDDSTMRNMDLKVSPVHDRRGRMTGRLIVLRDLTKQKRVEKARQQSEQRYRSLVENTMHGYFICEVSNGRFRFLNQTFCDLYGYTVEEGLELTVWDVVSPADREAHRNSIQAWLDGKSDNTDSRLYKAMRKDGSFFTAEVTSSLVTFQGSKAIQGVVRDVTEQERLRQQLHQAQRMESIGTLAGGIANDFNNLLMGIQGNASLMLLDVDSGHPHFERLRSIEQYVNNGADRTKQLLGFARSGKYEVKPTNLNEIIQKSSEMFGRAKKEIVIKKEFEKNLWPAEVDRPQIEQVLLNLYVNASQAMPRGGTLTIETRNVILDDDFVRPHRAAPGKYVKIDVADTGIGIDETTQGRVFDPFFTTKEIGRGTGLGLASAYGIIKNHGGIINVFSEMEKGATFTIYLPATEKEVREEVKRTEKPLKGSETILLVDDEEVIIGVGEKLLNTLGYRVMTARNGKDALRIYSENQADIDMVMLDLIMPGKSGGETFDELRVQNPEVKILLSSGYSLDGQARSILDRGCNGFIQKPFNLNELSKKLREIIDDKDDKKDMGAPSAG